MDFWDIIALVGWILSLLAFLIFAVLYWVGTRGYWRRSYVGRHLMSLAVVVVFILGVFLTRKVFGEFPWWRQLLSLGAVALAAVGWHRVALVITEQWGRDKE